MEADPRTLPTWVTEWRWRELEGTENFGRSGGRLDGSGHVLRAQGWERTVDEIADLPEYEGDR